MGRQRFTCKGCMGSGHIKYVEPYKLEETMTSNEDKYIKLEDGIFTRRCPICQGRGYL